MRLRSESGQVAGDGGTGIVSFGKLEKSGPDGGNGGDGGNVYIITESDLVHRQS